ncbi:hypothetical protein [Aeromonas diversa]|uniref:Uncharacterized protein n=1 Tax=Aeromonas diversa CDC 2478-85 TaxID=1268237 RepID=N9VNB4_9GAMM|nr:hypothetical protein [Aeromonas diversa]ENY73073.1 hypothetical protein G114_04851 [Aeromonas diversa CDC 2478-85]
MDAHAGWLMLMLVMPLAAKNNPTAECQWLHDRIEVLESAIEKGDVLGTREELARWKHEFRKKQCRQYDY